jgi:hypothetical protein
MLRFPTYKTLVENDNDLIGLIAYSLYKQEKFEFVADHKAANDGDEPSDDQMETYCRTANLASRIAGYRSKAGVLLQNIYQTTVETAVENVQKDFDSDLENMRKAHQAELDSHLRKIKSPSLGREVLVHALGGVIVWMGVVTVVMAGYFAKNGIPAAIQNLTDWRLIRDQPASKP